MLKKTENSDIKKVERFNSEEEVFTLSREDVIDLAFYNFQNALTACFITDPDLKVQKLNPIFISTFPNIQNIQNIRGLNLIDIFEEIKIPKHQILEFQHKIEIKKKVIISPIRIIIEESTRYFSLYGTAAEFKGIKELRGFQGQLIDITNKILLKKQQENVIYQIQHDMKNRISGILLGSNFLLEELNEFQKEEKQLSNSEYLDDLKIALPVIQENSRFLYQMVLQMLDLRKLQVGKLSLNLSHFSFKELLDKIISNSNILNKKFEKIVDVEVHATEDIQVEADYNQIIRVVENFHSNALKYTTDYVHWSFTKQGSDLIVSVRDNGIGIPKIYFDRIFDPFFQVPGLEKQGSTGLGLDSSKALIKMHKGKVWVSSEGEGKGAEFFFQIPITQTV
ncbi:MAG: signal transduction histidine kinase [bacterium]|jgi:signal transduction histidine kinase